MLIGFCVGCITSQLALSQQQEWTPDVVALTGYKEQFRGFKLPTIFPFIFRELHQRTPGRACFAPDGTRVLLAPGGWTIITDPWKGEGKFIPDASLYIWSLKTGSIKRRFQEHKGAVSGFAFSPDGRRVLSASTDKLLLFWDSDTGKVLHRMQGYGSNRRDLIAPVSIAFSANGLRVATMCFKSPVRIWDTLTGNLVREIEANPPLFGSLALSTDGKRLVWVEDKGLIHLTDVETGNDIFSLGWPSIARMPRAALFTTDDQRVRPGHRIMYHSAI